MINIRYVIAGMLLVGWMLGFFGLHLGKQTHLLLVMAMMTASMNIIPKEGFLKNL
jgi:hypothetical protein